jgi:hypothetical protein
MLAYNANHLVAKSIVVAPVTRPAALAGYETAGTVVAQPFKEAVNLPTLKPEQRHCVWNPDLATVDPTKRIVALTKFVAAI